MKSMLVFCVFLVIGAVECARIRRQAAVGTTTPKTQGMNVALGFMLDELNKEKGLGGPANPAGLQKATILGKKIELLGGTVDASNKDNLDSLLADAADPSFSQYAAGASKPDDTKVDLSQIIKRYLTTPKYKVVAELLEEMDFEDESGKLAIKLKMGSSNLEGSGNYLKETKSFKNKVDLLVKIHYETIVK